MTVVMPEAAVESKVAACLEYGAEVVLHGTHVGESLERLEELRAERGLVLVHPYDDPEVLLGNGSCGLEILEDLPDVDLLVVAVGGGGLLGGVTVAVRESRPRTRVWAVEPTGSDALRRAMAAGEPVRITPHSVADGLNAPDRAGGSPSRSRRRYLDGVAVIDDDVILAGLRFAAERLKQVVEPAGAAALAAVLSGRRPDPGRGPGRGDPVRGQRGHRSPRDAPRPGRAPGSPALMDGTGGPQIAAPGPPPPPWAPDLLATGVATHSGPPPPPWAPHSCPRRLPHDSGVRSGPARHAPAGADAATGQRGGAPDPARDPGPAPPGARPAHPLRHGLPRRVVLHRIHAPGHRRAADDHLRPRC